MFRNWNVVGLKRGNPPSGGAHTREVHTVVSAVTAAEEE
mgnify:CR=1 FL=1